jgi:hypothetical protein
MKQSASADPHVSLTGEVQHVHIAHHKVLGLPLPLGGFSTIIVRT